MDPSGLQAEIERLKSLLSERENELRTKDSHIELLEGKLRALQRHLFGRSSERFADHPELPFPGDEAEPATPDFAKDVPDDEERDQDNQGKPRRKRGTTSLPKDLPREREDVKLSEIDLHGACGCELTRIGEEVTEVLEYRPASFFIREIVRPKLACKQHEECGVFTLELPPRPIPKGMAGPSLLAQVITAKYKDHLPLHRQHGIYQRHGVNIAESTMVDWVRGTTELVEPIVAAIRTSILSRDIVATDDTPVCMLDRSHQNGSKKGFLWAYLGEPGEVAFDFTVSRSRAGPQDFFGDYRGYIQADAYSGYDVLFREQGRIEVGCWAHARRRFHKALESEPDHAKHAIAAIRMMYDVDRQAREAGLAPELRRELHLQQSKQMLEDFHPWLESMRAHVLPKSPMGKAVAYTLRQWGALTRFLDDGRLALDNNRCERAIRQVAIGRKNWMFAGSQAGGERAAAIYSLIGGCIELKVDPYAYLCDILQRAAEGEDANRLTPVAWSTAQG